MLEMGYLYTSVEVDHVSPIFKINDVVYMILFFNAGLRYYLLFLSYEFFILRSNKKRRLLGEVVYYRESEYSEMNEVGMTM